MQFMWSSYGALGARASDTAKVVQGVSSNPADRWPVPPPLATTLTLVRTAPIVSLGAAQPGTHAQQP